MSPAIETVLNDKTVIRELTNDITIFSTPFIQLYIFPFGGRSTAIKLKNGDIWLIASTPLNKITKEKLTDLGGPIKYLIAPDSEHHIWLKDYQIAYPDAKLIGVKGHLSRNEVRNKGKPIRFDGAYGQDGPETKYGYEDEIEAVYFPGHKNEEVAFYHKASKTLLTADLIFNLPSKESHLKFFTLSPFQWLRITPYGGFHKSIIKGFWTDEAKMRESAKAVASWDIERIIPCHGDVIDSDGSKAWRAAYGTLFEEK